MTFTAVRASPSRLPPSGMYRYSRRNRDKVICQRRQNSRMSVEWYGELKLTGIWMLNIRAAPKAMSV